MDKVEKFLRKLDAKRRGKLIAVIAKIGANRLDGLDIKPLQGFEGHFRCRVGHIRILFMHSHRSNIVYDVNFRGHIYR